MKNHLLLLSLLALVAWPGLGRGDVLLSFSPVSSTTIGPDGTVTFDVNLTVNGGESVAGVDYYLQAPATQEFILTSFDNSSSPFDTFGPTNPDNTLLSPASMDLGAAPASPVGNGTYLLSQITVQADSLGTGTYDLIPSSLSDWAEGVSPFSTTAFSTPFASLDITVVPEPPTAALLLAALAALTLTVGLGRRPPHPAPL